MVIINVPVILILGKPAVAALQDYRRQRAAGKNPHFKAADIGLTDTECWK
jgi:AGCS family alanine or glycine:cation symporter